MGWVTERIKTKFLGSSFYKKQIALRITRFEFRNGGIHAGFALKGRAEEIHIHKII
jgi:hypothetical protein